MSEQIFVIMGIPKSQPRNRHRMVKTKAGKVFTMNYEPEEAAMAKENTRAQIVNQLPTFIPRNVPIICNIEAYLPRPKNHYRSNGEVKSAAPRFCTSKPDKDNLEKAIYDAMTGVVWMDDCQVVDGRLVKFYGDVPKVVVKVREAL